MPFVQRGFTLIEMMIVIAVMGILMAIALPQYNDYLRRGQVAEATATLAELRVRMEQYYQDNRNYGDNDNTTTACGVAMPTDRVYFAFGCVTSHTAANADQAYTISATGKAGQVTGSGLAVYTINEANLRRTTKFNNADVAKNCWLVGGSEC